MDDQSIIVAMKIVNFAVFTNVELNSKTNEFKKMVLVRDQQNQ